VRHDLNDDAQRLFDELIELDPAARDARIRELAPDAVVSREVASLLAAADRAGDFLGVLRAASPRPEEAHGTVAGRYRIERHLGSGSMGDVYLAWDEELDRAVALKFLRDSTTADPAALARLRAEARATARLEHPHVATVYDIGETREGQSFIVMAYYPGETLRQRLARAPLLERDALRIAAQIAGALAAAHAAGIVHRDVKPANVLFDAEGGARLTDFGIAKLTTDSETADGGDVAGTPAYMSPERALGAMTDPSADLWALGVTLHEMLTGQRPASPELIDARRAPGDDDVVAGDPTEAGISSPRVLVAALLSANRAERLTDATSVREALETLIAAAEGGARSGGPGSGRGALPNTVTSLIGRERELAAAQRLLGETRLLTLTGPGGTGKTRLALEVATRERARFVDGVWFVPLAEIAEAALVPASVAQTLGVRDLGAMPLRDRTIAEVGARRLLLVLDNFEHVISAAPFVSELLQACPQLRILVTSRAPLGVQGEHLFPVPPLATPLPTDVDAAESAAVRLFVSRARAVRPSFALDAESLGAVAEICRRLDGLPLALELAAARAKLLSPRAILARLEQRFELLRAEAADRPVRHGTMRAVIDWSYILLTDAERAFFCRLAVFSGGVPLDAAEAVAASPEPDAAPTQVLNLLESLCGKSLLQAEEQPDGEPRFVMLETVRQYGLERLASGDDEASARREHRRFYVALAERAASRLRGPEQAEWLDRLEREYPNLRVAIEGALTDGANGLADAARLAVALHRLWLTRGPLFDGIRYLQRILAAVDAADAPTLDAALVAGVISSAAHLAGTRSVFPEARDLFERSLALSRAAGDRRAVAETLNNLAWQVWNMGDLARGEALSREAMSIHEGHGNELGVTLSRNNLAWIAMEQCDFDSAERHFEAVIASHQRRGDVRAGAFAMSWLGVLASRRGDLARAIELHEQALALGDPVADLGYRTLVLVRLAAARHALGESNEETAEMELVQVPALRAFGRLWPLAYGLTELGAMLLDEGEAGRALSFLEEAFEARRTSGGAAGVAEALMLLGVAKYRSGDRTAGITMLGQGLVASRDYGSRLLMIACLEAIAPLAIDAGKPESAAVLLSLATEARNVLGMRRSPRRAVEHARIRRSLADGLGDAHLARASEVGVGMSLEEGTTYALSELRGMDR
jgi:predicted ATPase